MSRLKKVQGDFFNWASPENAPALPPPYFEKVLSMAAGRGEIPNTITFSIPRGGQAGTLTFLFKSVTYRPKHHPVTLLWLHFYFMGASIVSVMNIVRVQFKADGCLQNFNV